MVAGVQYHRVWKIKSKAIRTSSDDVQRVISKKRVFCRSSLEKTMGLTQAQAYWYIQKFLTGGSIKKLDFGKNINRMYKQEMYYKVVHHPIGELV